jgi:hypothetical protein
LIGHQAINATKEFLMLLFIGEPNQCFQRHVVAEKVVAAEVQDQRVHEALNQTKDIGAATPMNLTEVSLLFDRTLN